MEIWKTIKDHPDYKISNLGNVKSLKLNKIRNLNPSKNNDGYLQVGLSKKGCLKTFHIHKLVAIHFLNHKPCGMKLVINHKDLNKQNNNINNLEIVTNRENSNMKHIESNSKYTGVSWDNQRNKWKSTIYINGKLKFLGRFNNEKDASIAYQNELYFLKTGFKLLVFI